MVSVCSPQGFKDTVKLTDRAGKRVHTFPCVLLYIDHYQDIFALVNFLRIYVTCTHVPVLNNSCNTKISLCKVSC